MLKKKRVEIKLECKKIHVEVISYYI